MPEPPTRPTDLLYLPLPVGGDVWFVLGVPDHPLARVHFRQFARFVDLIEAALVAPPEPGTPTPIDPPPDPGAPPLT